ncbi:mediator of RNA polymerase II transcription subunit 8-like isoform X2 [Eriocheir sinensis]|uniref:mediator of RNA polymerase II transcription subunit 8-like isoform X2 n=1 Tax=Eriocheir sinensis TaxID=95602 RepID=UPI0021C801CF|nr:mediator of RNA polymerase II transcription subunit 8-like isoform X2 [Eriocheir sinensis]XP_050714956.1 mediator of RNA polymerase II transcription subunit 8-like isoform X2 [Eriocheir sinensis]
MQLFHPSQREERLMDATLDAILQRVVDIKGSLQELMVKTEREGEQGDWPSYLNSFSVISAQIYTLMKLLKNEKTPILRNYLTLPLQLNAESDEKLLVATEGRVPSFSHDFVPNMLRTKPEPDVEQKHQALETKMTQINSDTAQKQINIHNKVVKHVMDLVNTAREEWETETAARTSQPQTCSLNETQALVAALGTGKGFKMRAQPPGPSPTIQQPPPQITTTSKAPSAVKTNIKAASAIHPYGR